MLDPASETRLRAVLKEISRLRDALQQLEHEVVHLTISLGVTWEEVGEAHDPPIARQNAQKRYSHPKPRRARG